MLVIEALRQVHIPWYKALILRKTFPQLRELIDKTLNYYPRAYPKARYNGSNHTWRFPSGAQIVFGSMNRPQDKIQYQGQAYDFIAFDELTHFTQEEYDYLKSRNRPNGAETRVYMRSTANPGNIGHGWVKERFITAAPPMQPITEEAMWYTPDGKKHTGQQQRIFVPSSVFDNKILMENDPLYVQRLASMPEAERNALLYGNWDSFEGQVFTEWKNDREHYLDRKNTHVIEPFRIPEDWVIWCGLDWELFPSVFRGVVRGGQKPADVPYPGVLRLQRDPQPRRDVGADQGGAGDTAHRTGDPNLRGRDIHRVGDPAIWQSDGTESVGALMERERVYFEKGDHARINGKMQIHHRLAFDADGVPMLYVFSTCKNFIRTVPNLVYDQTDVEEDIDTDGEDHIYDQLRYVCMKNPIGPRDMGHIVERPYSPLRRTSTGRRARILSDLLGGKRIWRDTASPALCRRTVCRRRWRRCCWSGRTTRLPLRKRTWSAVSTC